MMTLPRLIACLALALTFTTHARAGLQLELLAVNHLFNPDSLPMRALDYDPVTGDLLTAELFLAPGFEDVPNPGIPGTLVVRQRTFESRFGLPTIGMTTLFSFPVTDLSAEVLKVLPNGNLLMLQAESTLVEVDRSGSLVPGGFSLPLAFDPPLGTQFVLDAAVDYATGDVYVSTRPIVEIRRFTSDGVQVALWNEDNSPGHLIDSRAEGLEFHPTLGKLILGTDDGLTLLTPDGQLTIVDRHLGGLLSAGMLGSDFQRARLYIENEENLYLFRVVPEPSALACLFVVAAGIVRSRRRVCLRRSA